MEHYDQTPLAYDMSRFLDAMDGFYSFASINDFVAALSSNVLSQIDHPFEYNCFVAALLVASHDMAVTDQFSEETGPYLGRISSKKKWQIQNFNGFFADVGFYKVGLICDIVPKFGDTGFIQNCERTGCLLLF